MKTFVTSDTHFNHANIIGFAERPFKNVDHMNTELVLRWNKVVGKDDVVFHLGDFGMGTPQDLMNIVCRLNGRLVLVTGNHDKSEFLTALHEVGIQVQDYYNIKGHTINNMVCMFHYPMLSWDGSFHGSISLHGHTHSKNLHDFAPMSSQRFNVAVEAHDYTPVYLPDIEKLYLASKATAPIDYERVIT